MTELVVRRQLRPKEALDSFVARHMNEAPNLQRPAR